MSNKKNKSMRVVNASKRSAIAEHLVNNIDCFRNYNLKKFNFIKNCFNFFVLIKLEAICFLLRNLNCVNIKILIILFFCCQK